jgi:quinol monooxygenase YgiN
VAIRVIVEFRAEPGRRAELVTALGDVMARIGTDIPGFLGSTVHAALDSPDVLVEIAEWESADAQAAAVKQAMESGTYGHVFELLAEPPRATRVARLDEQA